MNGDYLLDSNIIIDVFRGEKTTINRVKKIRSIYIPSIVLGELYFGANKSNQTFRRIQEIEQLERDSLILEVKESTARIYGKIKHQLRLSGRPIPENDIWIAALSKEHELTILTRDRHFGYVEGILIENLGQG